MPDHPGDAEGRSRARELLRLRAARELTGGERSELIGLLARHPDLASEEPGPDPDGRSRPPEVPAPAARQQSRRPASATAPVGRRLGLLTGAAALVALGAIGGALLNDWLSSSLPPTGPPGTFGAVEGIDFVGQPPGVRLNASVVAHAWGTETLLDIDGLPVGETFEVVVIGTDALEYPAGTFISAEERVSCAMNAAVLRPDVAQIEVRDGAGEPVMASALPEAFD